MAEELENSNKSSWSGRIWTFILIVVMLGFGAFAVKTFVDDHNRNNTAENTDVNRDNIAQEFAPPVTQPPVNNQPTPTIRGPVGNIPKQPKVLGSEITKTSTAPVYVPYRNEALGFSTMVPSDTQVTVQGNEAIAGSPQGTYFTLTAYSNTEETLDTVETQLRNSPSVTSVTRTNLGSIPALQFTSPNFNNASSYAFITNGRLYYLIGNFTRPESWKDFKFF